MKILVDLQGCQSSSRYRGVGRYASELTKSLIRRDKQNDYTLLLNGALGFVDEIKSDFASLLPEKNILCWTQYTGISSSTNHKKEIFISEIIREAFIYQQNADLLFIPNFQEGWEDAAVTSIGRLQTLRKFATSLKIIATLHDVIPLLNEDEYLGLKSPIRPWYFEKLSYLHDTDLQLTDTYASQAEISAKLNLPSLHVVPCGINKKQFGYLSSDETKDILLRLSIPEKFILYTGGTNPHKNLINLYKAFSQLPQDIQDQYTLVVAGKKPVDIDNIINILSKLGISTKVYFTGYVSDTELRALYSSCELFVFPSYQEGFGMPPLEAMASGAVVIAADIPVMREIIGNEVDSYFDPFNVTSISEKITLAIRNETFRKLSKANAFKRAQIYTWDKSAEKFLGVISSIDTNHFSKRETLTANEILSAAIEEITNSNFTFTKNDFLHIALLLSKNIVPEHRNPKKYIDISAMIHDDSKTGIQRVVRAITTELTSLADNIEVIYSFPYDRTFRKAKKDATHFYCASESDEVVDFFPKDQLIYLDLHPLLAVSHRIINNDLKDRGVEVYYVVYDLIPLHKPDNFVAKLSLEFTEWAKTVSYANGIICISRSVADEYIAWIKSHAPSRKTELKVGYFHLGADIKNSLPTSGLPDDAKEILDYIDGKLNFIMVGTLEPRKGHIQIIKCFDELWSQGIDANLLIIGRQGWLSENLVNLINEHPELGKKLHWFNGISDEYLDELYKKSSCLIAASEAEGFGLPLIEAGMKGIAIIARNIPVFKEVAGENAFYFSGITPLQQSEEIKQWIDLWNRGMHPVSSGMKCLTWKESAEQFLNCLNNSVWYHTCKFDDGDLA
ncbi:glycosyltransferase family 4 protein [Sodalis sp. RH16]|uniref:glycosyltransferase family 4 protein n=1 Tax=Sodalis sp. RH16 TaxID=3394331 RepID=UPI0039B54A69